MSRTALYLVKHPAAGEPAVDSQTPQSQLDGRLFDFIHWHGRRVATLAFGISRQLGATESAAGLIARAAIHHDLGKLAVSSDLLFYPGALSDLEKRLLHAHTIEGSALALTVLASVPGNQHISGVICGVCRHHHERWDGEGYPDGLRGSQIPIAARIVAVADVYDALTSERPYRSPMRPQDAFAAIRVQSGGHFDPDVVDAFHAVVGPHFNAGVAPMHRVPGANGSLDRWIYRSAVAALQTGYRELQVM